MKFIAQNCENNNDIVSLGNGIRSAQAPASLLAIAYNIFNIKIETQSHPVDVHVLQFVFG